MRILGERERSPPCFALTQTNHDDDDNCVALVRVIDRPESQECIQGKLLRAVQLFHKRTTAAPMHAQRLQLFIKGPGYLHSAALRPPAGVAQ